MYKQSMVIKRLFFLCLLISPFISVSASDICLEILTKMQENIASGENVYKAKYYDADETLNYTVTSIVLGSPLDNGQSYFSFYYDEPKVIPNLEAYISDVQQVNFQSCRVIFSPVEGAPPKYEGNETPLTFSLLNGSVVSFMEEFSLELLSGGAE